MTVKELRTLIDSLDEYIRVPGGIERVRKTILHLALSGQLAPQDLSEGTGEELYDQIQLEKNKLIRDGKSKKRKDATELTAHDTPFKIPYSWCWVRLGDVVEMTNGYAFKSSQWIDSGLPIVRIQNLNNITAQFNYVDEESVAPRYIIENGQVLLSWSGTPGTSFGVFLWNRGRAALNQHIFKCRLFGIDSDFFRLAANNAINAKLHVAHGGVGLKHLTKTQLESLMLPLPPLAEQIRIVQGLGKVFTLLNRLEADSAAEEKARRQLGTSCLAKLSEGNRLTFDHFDEIIKTPDDIRLLEDAVRTIAIRAQLVPQDMSEGTGQDFYMQIQAEKARLIHEKKMKKQKEILPIHSDEIPFEIPSTWKWVRLADLASQFIDGDWIESKDQSPDGIRLLQVGNVGFGVFHEKESRAKYISEDTFERLRCTELKEGDVLISRLPAPVGRATVIGPMRYRAITAVDCTITRFISPVLAEYFVNYSMTSIYLKQVGGNLAGTTRQRISRGNLGLILVPLPPLKEQIRINNQIREIISLTNKIKDLT